MGDPTGRVFLVGAGPGDPGLLTLRGAEALAQADVVIYDGLASPVLLELAPPEVETIYAGKKHSPEGAPLTQDEIHRLLIERARRGQTVVRLKGGDPFVFGRGGEEAAVLAAEGIRFELVPGVTAATAVPAYAGIPLTHREAATTVAFATGHESEDKTAPTIDWSSIARADTIVLFMAVKTLAHCAAGLVRGGRAADTPVAVIHWGTTPAQRTVTGTLADIAARVEDAGLKPPGLVVIGEVVRYRETLSWYERRPLFGSRVLVPRQKSQAKGFARALLARGAEPVIVEVTHLVPVDPAPLLEALARASTWRWIAFTSVNTVERVCDALLDDGGDVRGLAGCRLAAVGGATATALRRRGLRPELVPERQDGAGVASAMVAADPDLPGAAVLLPRAVDGREELAAALVAAGARPTVVPVYRSVPASPAELAGLCARLRHRSLDILTFFSPSQVEVVLTALGEDGPAVLGAARLVAAIGATTAEALRRHGVRVDLVPPSPSAEELADLLAERTPSEVR
jgi:uroporphyrinogen III methyltransferase/synthase